MKFSIVLPVRNGGKFVKECVSSILTQSYQDFILHILDNCSTDGTIEWIKSLKDDRIVLIESEKDLTIEESWARVVRIKKNEFLTLIGHDDLLHSHYLAVMRDLIESSPKASLYQTHFNLIDENGNELRKAKPMAEKQTAAEFLEAVLQNDFDVFGTGYMMRSKDYDALGGIPAYPNLLFADFELWMSLTRLNYKATAKQECFSYRLHQSTTKISSNKKMLSAFERFIHYLKSLKSDPRLNDVVQYKAISFLHFYCRSLVHRLLKTPLANRDGVTIKTLVENFKRYADILVERNSFAPESDMGIRLAKLIDSNFFTRKGFIAFKKLYSKPMFK